MADFATVLRKAIGALKDNNPKTREKIYQKARATIEAKLAAASPSPELAAHQRRLLEDAIAKVEAEYAPAPEPAEPEDDLESLFAEIRASGTTKKAPEIRPLEETPAEPAPSPDPLAADEHEKAQHADHADDEAEPAELPHDGLDDTPAEEAEGEPPHRDEWVEDAPVQGPEAFDQELPPAPPRRKSAGGGLALLLLLLLVLAAAGYGAWLYRDDMSRLAGYSDFDDLIAGQSEPPASAEQESAEPPKAAAATPEQPEPAAVNEPEEPAPQRPQKFTQRLLPDGEEVDEGPAGDEPTLGEGTSVAAATQSDAAQVEASEETASPDSQQAVPVGQKAIFYEERTNTSQGSADGGSVVWSLVEESPGENLPPEPAIRAEATIPDKGLQLKMTIRRNADESLPASHIVELIFLTPDGFGGGGINSVLRIAMKRSEQDTGSPLIGIPARIADGFFLVALSDRQADLTTNSSLLRRQSWIDIPIVYASGRRALITLEKGVPGDRIFSEALDAWAKVKASSG